MVLTFYSLYFFKFYHSKIKNCTYKISSRVPLKKPPGAANAADRARSRMARRHRSHRRRRRSIRRRSSSWRHQRGIRFRGALSVESHFVFADRLQVEVVLGILQQKPFPHAGGNSETTWARRRHRHVLSCRRWDGEIVCRHIRILSGSCRREAFGWFGFLFLGFKRNKNNLLKTLRVF